MWLITYEKVTEYPDIQTGGTKFVKKRFNLIIVKHPEYWLIDVLRDLKEDGCPAGVASIHYVLLWYVETKESHTSNALKQILEEL